MQRGLIDDRARDGGGPIGQRSDGQSIEPVGPVRVQVALHGNLVELLCHARFLLHARKVMPSLLVANDVFLTRIVVVGSVPGQEGGLDPSKGGNGGWKFFRAAPGEGGCRQGWEVATRRAGGVLWRVPLPGCGSPPGAYCRWY